MDIQALWDSASQFIILYGLRIVVAIVIFLVGRWLAKLLKRSIQNSMQAKGVDLAVSQFAGSLTYALVLAFTIVAALSHVGVQTASMIAALGAAGLAVGLALQGSLANFAAGILIIIFKPCRVGDYIEGAGVSGSVEDISLLATSLLTPDNKRVVIPNASLMSDPITNYSAMPTRRIDLVIGISYDADIKTAKQILEKVLNEESRILADPAYTIAAAELGDSSVNLVVRPWVNTSDYWPTRFDLTERIKYALDEANIGIPYPQMDVHLQQQ